MCCPLGVHQDAFLTTKDGHLYMNSPQKQLKQTEPLETPEALEAAQVNVGVWRATPVQFI